MHAACLSGLEILTTFDEAEIWVFYNIYDIIIFPNLVINILVYHSKKNYRITIDTRIE